GRGHIQFPEVRGVAGIACPRTKITRLKSGLAVSGRHPWTAEFRFSPYSDALGHRMPDSLFIIFSAWTGPASRRCPGFLARQRIPDRKTSSCLSLVVELSARRA